MALSLTTRIARITRVGHVTLALALLAALSGCASSTARMQETRELAAEAAKLGSYKELSLRFRDTYQREQPYLTAAADGRERLLDARRRAASDDFLAIGKSVMLYLQTLGALAGDSQYDLEDQVKAVGAGIKAWPDSGLDDRHVNAFAGMTRLLARSLSAPYQERAVAEIARAGRQPLSELLDAMRTLLRYYDKTHDNEQKIVLGALESQIALADPARERLLLMLAKSHQQGKLAEYRLVGRRLTLAAQQLDSVAQAHQRLLLRLEQQDGGQRPAPAAPPQLAETATEPD